MSRRSTGRTYTQAQRVEGLDLAGSVGFAEAGRQLGIPDGTLRRWAHEASAVGLEVAMPNNPVPWPERRAALLPKLGHVAAKALDAAESAIDAGKGREAQALMVSAGIAIDKGQLLAGGATSRSESRSMHVEVQSGPELAERVQAMRRQLGYEDAIEVGEAAADAP